MASTLFIPDISGFTRFVNDNEIAHSQHIIEELLNILIKTGKRSLELAEVEGDAVFFYKHNETLDRRAIEQLSKEMYTAFHRHLQLYEHKRICQCGACTQATNLKIKFIGYQGKVTISKLGKNSVKPYGSPVIAAHRLLKNDVEADEYILLGDQIQDVTDGKSGYTIGSKQDDELGELPYFYKVIEDWKPDLEEVKKYTTGKKVDLEVRHAGKVNLDVGNLFTLVSDLKYRKIWNDEADEILFEEGEINQEGSQHYCVIKGENHLFDTIKPRSERTNWAYGEVLRNPKGFKYIENNFLLFPVDDHFTNIEFVFRMNFKWWFQFLLKPLFRAYLKRTAKKIVESMISGAEKFKKLEY